tara:strand:+ start:627 stop:1238 length:612 start_codon:yes stop_codon:yes gene_type:complete
MVKEPRIGRVKSRLAKGVGVVNAWAFYRKTLSDVARRLVVDGRWRVSLGVSPNGAQNKPKIWPIHCRCIVQGSGNLGTRMARLMNAFPKGPVILVGADIPGIQASHIFYAFKLLGRCDAVFGPASDGGYWMIGLKHCSQFFDIFSDVRWSGPHALSDTIANLPTSWNYGLAATLDDIDDHEDFKRLKAQAVQHSRSYVREHLN